MDAKQDHLEQALAERSLPAAAKGSCLFAGCSGAEKAANSGAAALPSVRQVAWACPDSEGSEFIVLLINAHLFLQVQGSLLGASAVAQAGGDRQQELQALKVRPCHNQDLSHFCLGIKLDSMRGAGSSCQAYTQ